MTNGLARRIGARAVAILLGCLVVLALSACAIESDHAAPSVQPTIATAIATTAAETRAPQPIADEAADPATPEAAAIATPEALEPSPTPEYPTGQAGQLQGVVPPPPALTSISPDSANATVVIDPGHGGPEIGAAGFGLLEKASNLDLAFRVEALLAAQGVRVILTRREDTRVTPEGFVAAGFSATRTDLQTRIDIANAAEADVFVSIHSNAHGDSSLRGVEVYANSLREHATENRALGSSILGEVLGELAAIGRPTVNRGVRDDSCLRRRGETCFGLFLLSPPRMTTRDDVIRRGGDPLALGFTEGIDGLWTRPSEMPAVLVELLFISNADDAAMLKDEAVRDAMARGVAAGVLVYLEERGLWPR